VVAETAPARYEHRHLIWPSVVRPVERGDSAVQALGGRRPAQNLEGSGGNHYLIGRLGAVVDVDEIAPDSLGAGTLRAGHDAGARTRARSNFQR
jgi:hypothetical protein